MSPRAYEALLLDSQRATILAYILMAGIAATFVVVAVSRHRAWLHVSALLALGVVIDVGVIFGDYAGQPLWFRTLVIALLPVQALAGKVLGAMTWRLGTRSRASTKLLVPSD